MVYRSAIKIIAIGCFCAVALISADRNLFRDSQEWIINDSKRIAVNNQDYPHLNPNARILDVLGNVDYAAVVFQRSSLDTANGWLLSDDSHSAALKIIATVEHSVKGEKLDFIVYNSTFQSMVNYPVFVGLKKTKDGKFYVPDNGYEFPATTEAIDFLKSSPELGL